MEAVNIAFAVYPVTSIGKAREFYEKVLGLKATSVWVKDDSFGMVEYDIGPTTLAIGAGADTFKVGEGGSSVALEVTDFDSTVKELKSKGGKFIVEPTETPVCHMAVLVDPDGNKITIHRKKPA
jgi:predicted enzyme related to lactoylglutathione lyase